jgi:hypothetical protein
VQREGSDIEMKIFSHGSIVNFQPSAREMFPHDLERLLRHFIADTDSVLVGTIDLEVSEIRVYGRTKSVQFNEPLDRVTFIYAFLDKPDLHIVQHTIEELTISHEAMFDILDRGEQSIPYRVLYVTFAAEEQEKEVTYFFADEDMVQEPLAYVAEFWQQVIEVGRDVDFHRTGCAANVWNYLPVRNDVHE